MDYPFKPPKFQARTKIYHPDVTDLNDGTLHFVSSCSSCGLGDWWSPALTITRVLQRIQDAMLAPDIDTLDCCAPEIRKTINCGRDEFEKIAREWTKRYAIP